MQLQERITALSALGDYLRTFTLEEKEELARKAEYYNPWFTVPNVLFALKGIDKFLTTESLSKLAGKYEFSSEGKKIGLVMAGNIPLVGFHDLMCILLAGHSALIKLSSKDNVLPRFIFDLLKEVAPELHDRIFIAERLQDFDGIIATGSDNTSRYFEYYFQKYPNVIRKNRTSVAVLTGNESPEELDKLADDIFMYFGLGCRNVSKVFIPEDYDFEPLFQVLDKYEDYVNHNKYRNNYDYYKSIYLVNREDFLDTGFVMFKKEDQLVSPVSVVFYQFYDNLEEVRSILNQKNEKIQVVVASERNNISNSVPFGKAQLPEIDDFADRVDTMEFLTQIH